MYEAAEVLQRVKYISNTNTNRYAAAVAMAHPAPQTVATNAQIPDPRSRIATPRVHTIWQICICVGNWTCG